MQSVTVDVTSMLFGCVPMLLTYDAYVDVVWPGARSKMLSKGVLIAVKERFDNITKST